VVAFLNAVEIGVSGSKPHPQTPSEGTVGRAMRLKWQEQRPNSGRGG
jgi:hypothetical protein